MFNNYFTKKNKVEVFNKQELIKINDFYSMLLKIEKKRPRFSAKRVIKRIYPNYFIT